MAILVITRGVDTEKSPNLFTPYQSTTAPTTKAHQLGELVAHSQEVQYPCLSKPGDCRLSVIPGPLGLKAGLIKMGRKLWTWPE